MAVEIRAASSSNTVLRSMIAAGHNFAEIASPSQGQREAGSALRGMQTGADFSAPVRQRAWAYEG
jgi:hypothetical protein